MAVYDAFISYSHAKDKPIAAALQLVIQWVDISTYREGANPRDHSFLDLGAHFAAAIHGMRSRPSLPIFTAEWAEGRLRSVGEI